MQASYVMTFYIGIFGRPADRFGFDWFSERTKGGTDFSTIEDVTGTQEYLSLYEGMAPHNVIESIYLELFHRTPEAAGLQYWTERFTSGDLDLTNIAINITAGAQGQDLDFLINKSAAAYTFMNELDTTEEQLAYVGPRAEAFGRSYLDGVTNDPATMPTLDEVGVAIAGLVQSYHDSL